MSLYTALASILAITAVAWLVARGKHNNVCAFCVGVAGTWLWMLVARAIGFSVDPLTLAVLMGGSAVGVSFRYQHLVPQGRSPILWKVVSILPAFGAAHAIVQEHWLAAVAALAVTVIACIVFLRSPKTLSKTDADRVKDLKKKMEQCC